MKKKKKNWAIPSVTVRAKALWLVQETPYCQTWLEACVSRNENLQRKQNWAVKSTNLEKLLESSNQFFLIRAALWAGTKGIKSNRENPKHHVVATIRKLRPDKNSPTVRVSLPRLPHDILDFSFCPLPRVLHVTLANWQGFGFEFHLRSSPSEFEGVYMISRSADYYIICYTVLKRCNKVETADHGRNSWLSVWTLSCRCPVKLTT